LRWYSIAALVSARDEEMEAADDAPPSSITEQRWALGGASRSTREGEKFMTYQRFSRQSGVLLALATCACGGASLNQGKLAEAQSALHVAETLGAENDPKAKQSLQLARDQTAKAKRLSAEGDGDEADLYLERATADADLASQLMRTRTEEDKAKEAWEKSKTSADDPRAPQ
jgi:hypothetical protein